MHPLRHILRGAMAICALVSPLCGSEKQPERARLELVIEEDARVAFVVAPPDQSTPAPVVFVFHGHGGTALQAARAFRIRQHWPEAIAVYMQGLNTPGRLTDPQGKKPGWQARAGDQNDRDLEFFDALLARLEQDYHLDKDRLYATGHSNGGSFTYLLWAERGDRFAAFAPSASAAAESLPKLKPKPALHAAGENDPLVRFAWQQRTMQTVRRIAECAATGSAWAENCTFYPSKVGAPFVAFIHADGHKLPAAAPALIVRFFKEHTRKKG